MKRYILNKSILFILCFIILFIYSPSLFKKHRDGQKWDYIYNPKNNLDILFMGSSYIFTGLNPIIIDSIIMKDSFILGSIFL